MVQLKCDVYSLFSIVIDVIDFLVRMYTLAEMCFR